MTLSTLIWAGLMTVPAGLSGWCVARWLETRLSPRSGVRLWQMARLAAFAPFIMVMGQPILNALRTQGWPVGGESRVETGTQTVEQSVPSFQPVIEFFDLTLQGTPGYVWPLIVGLYVLGLGLMLTRAVVNRRQIQLLMKASRLETGSLTQLASAWRRRLGLKETVAPVRVVDAQMSPFVVGLKPVILAPESLSGAKEAEAVIAHELMHIKRGDEHDRLLGEALTSLLWFNPVYRAIERRLAAARELACDADVLDAMGPHKRHHYAEAIAGLAPMPAVATGFLTDLERLRRRRVQAALSHNGLKPRKSLAVIAGAVILAAAVPSASLALMMNTQTQQTSGQSRALSPSVGEQVVRAQEALDAGDPAEALNAISGMGAMTPYERFVVEQLRGRAFFQNRDYQATAAAFEAALATGAATPSERQGMILNTLQLYLVLDQRAEISRTVDAYIQTRPALDAQTSKLLSQVLTQLERYEEALPYAERARQLTRDQDPDVLSVLQYLYQEAGRTDEARAIYDIVVERFPEAINPN